MKEIKIESNSEGSIQLYEDVLKKMLDGSAEVLLTIFNQFGEDSKQYLIAESYFESIKAGYAFCTAKKEFNDLCKEHQMTFNADAVEYIKTVNKLNRLLSACPLKYWNKADLQKQFDELGLNR